MTPAEETTWLAGILEGEGCFSPQKAKGGRRASCRVQLKMGDKDVIERAKALVPGCCGIYESKRTDLAKHKIEYAIVWTGWKAENLMRRVLFHMSARRKEKIAEVLAMDLSHHTRKAVTV